jgi:hypothetical protein
MTLTRLKIATEKLPVGLLLILIAVVGLLAQQMSAARQIPGEELTGDTAKRPERVLPAKEIGGFKDDYDARSGVLANAKKVKDYLIVKLDKGNSYAVDAKTKVLIDGKEATSDDLRAGMVVYLELQLTGRKTPRVWDLETGKEIRPILGLNLNQAKLVRASWMKSRGVVASAVDVDARKFEFMANGYDVIEGKEQAAVTTVRVAKDAAVFIDDKESRFADLKAKMEAVLYSRADTGEAVKIKARTARGWFRRE